MKVIQPGGGFTSYAYDGNTVTVTEPLSDPTKPRWKKYTTDGLGRLVQVSEPRPGVSGATDETVYEYNVLDKLTKVTMTRGSTTQVRNFSYDAEMRLQSVAQPENGTVSYTYDTLGRILTRIDAKNQKTEYGYETHGRISTVKRYPVSTGAEDAAQRTTYNYDTAVNGWGRVASVVTGQGYTESFEYSAGGAAGAGGGVWVQQRGPEDLAEVSGHHG